MAIEEEESASNALMAASSSAPDALHGSFYSQKYSSPLIRACNDGFRLIVKKLLDHGCDPNVRGTDGTGRFPLHYAIGNRIHDPASFKIIVELLIQNGANVNAQDDTGTTVLLQACENDDICMVEDLINAGSDVNICNGAEQSPFKLACQGVEYWFFRQNGVSVDNSVHYPPWVQMCRLLLKAGADIREATFLPTAVLYAQTEMITEILSLGMGVNMLDAFARSPLVCASGAPNVGCDILKILLDHNADVNKGGKFKPMRYAYMYNFVDKMKLLLSYGADVTSEEMSAFVCSSMNEFIIQNHEVVTLDSKELVPWRLLTAAGARPIIQGELEITILKLHLYSHYAEIKLWIWSLLGPLLSLKDCCRVEIRKHLSPIIDEKIDHLPLPRYLKNYLKFEEFSDECA